ncbi:MAG TPA: hypothetical protein VF200_06185 [Woeseiaceae bacterium]
MLTARRLLLAFKVSWPFVNKSALFTLVRTSSHEAGSIGHVRDHRDCRRGDARLRARAAAALTNERCLLHVAATLGAFASLLTLEELPTAPLPSTFFVSANPSRIARSTKGMQAPTRYFPNDAQGIYIRAAKSKRNIKET